ncbi:MAG TPA: GWxTD domain-containing protein [Pyrinomonadaceae bacterium]|nr:GWxTD domain-containing protein [Pyrinomonadaceae bacterium]
MLTSAPFRTFAFVLAFLLTTSLVPAQNKPPQSPDLKPRKVKDESKRVFKDWPKTDVALIITPDELRAYEKLTTNEEREHFIEDFWRVRDLTPDTEENEYKDEYYERIAYADEHFSSGKPGHLTDRGRIYIKFGKPDEVESHPMGGAYDRPSYEGGGSTSTYPFEKWFYRNIPGVRSGVDIEFVDPTGSGEYRLARNPDEKDALIHVAGAGQTLAERLGFADRADRIAGLGGFGIVNYQRAQDSPFEVLQLLTDIERVQNVKRDYFGRGLIGTPKIDDSPLNFEVQAHFFRQSDNRVLTAFTIQADNKDLVFADSGGLQTARLNITGRISTITERAAGRFEDAVVTTALPSELTELKERRSAYGRAVILEPGRYRLDLMVRDVNSGATGIQHYGFEVPRYNAQQLATSSIVLAAKLESMTGKVAAGPFLIGQTKVVPNLSGDFRRGQPVGVYLQVYNIGIDQTTLEPAVDVEYQLLREGIKITEQKEDWRGAADAGPRLTLTRLIDTKDLTPGEYEVVVRVRDHVTGQTLAPSAYFRIVR